MKITLDDFFKYTGRRLEAEMKSDDNPSATAESFLMRSEIRLEAHLLAKYGKNIEKLYPNFTPFQKLHYKYALIEQALYVFRNGDISTDSGYDAENGIITDRKKLEELKISPNAKEHLESIGLLSRQLTVRKGGYDGWFV